MILGLFSEALSAGGIQRVALHTAAALRRIADETGTDASFLSLNDALGDHTLTLADASLRIRGCGRSKSRFVRDALAQSSRVRHVYINHIGLAPVGAAIRLRRSTANVWVHLHGIEVWDPLPLARRQLLRAVTGYFAISTYTADRAAKAQGIPRDKISVLPNALDPDLLARAENAPAASRTSGQRLLTVARLAASEKYKGVDSVVRALPALRGRFPNLTYVVIGDGDDRPRLEALARDLGVEAMVQFRGRVSESDLVKAYQTADLFVMPSRGEGLGVVYLEAMAFGLPVIAGQHGGAPEVVRHGETGFLVAHDDIIALADDIAKLLQDPEASRKMGLAGRRRVEDEYTFEHFARRLRVALDGPRTT